MSAQRLIPRAALILLVLGTLGAGRHRHPFRANRPAGPLSGMIYNASLASRPAKSTGDLHTLQQAYSLLENADHDYKGHRVKAMHAIRKAARMMGAPVSAIKNTKGNGTVPQSVSDSHLKQAQGLIQQVKGTVKGRTQGKVVQQLDQAVQHLSTALTIK